MLELLELQRRQEEKEKQEEMEKHEEMEKQEEMENLSKVADVVSPPQHSLHLKLFSRLSSKAQFSIGLILVG